MARGAVRARCEPPVRPGARGLDAFIQLRTLAVTVHDGVMGDSIDG
jgi:hypothetical protein